MKLGCLLKRAAMCVVGLAMLSVAAGAQAKKGEAEPMKLKVGDTAPDFKLQYFDGSDLKNVSLGEYRGKSNVVVAFYVFAFTGG
ncbi:MAG: hypothetical protein WBQ72_03390 [Terriglobales bacterium]|jgi:hypothetical protein